MRESSLLSVPCRATVTGDFVGTTSYNNGRHELPRKVDFSHGHTLPCLQDELGLEFSE